MDVQRLLHVLGHQPLEVGEPEPPPVLVVLSEGLQGRGRQREAEGFDGLGQADGGFRGDLDAVRPQPPLGLQEELPAGVWLDDQGTPSRCR